MISSRALADVVADAVGIAPESAQLHLKTIRADGQITFKGYGRGAAAMTPLDASRLLIAITGSTFAKDSVEVLKRFAHLKPVREDGPRDTLEQSLAELIDDLPMDILPVDAAKNRLVHARPYGSRRLADTALQLLDPIGTKKQSLPAFAILRWITQKGHSHVRVFGQASAAQAKGMSDQRENNLEALELIGGYLDHRLFQIRALRRAALIDVAVAIKGLDNELSPAQ